MATMPPEVTLTARQVEVVELLALGLSNVEIAERRGVALVTIEGHLARIYDSLSVVDERFADEQAWNRRIALARLWWEHETPECPKTVRFLTEMTPEAPEQGVTL